MSAVVIKTIAMKTQIAPTLLERIFVVVILGIPVMKNFVKVNSNLKYYIY